MKFNKEEDRELHLGRNNPRHSTYSKRLRFPGKVTAILKNHFQACEREENQV